MSSRANHRLTASDARVARHLSHEWATFLTSPLPLAATLDDAAELEQVGREHLRHLIDLTIQQGLLSASTCLVQFVHVAPGRSVDFGITTALRTDLHDRLLAAISFHGSFVKRSRLSFFERAMQMGHGGLMYLITPRSPPEPILPGIAVRVVRSVPKRSIPPRRGAAELSGKPIAGTGWALLSEEHIKSFIATADADLGSVPVDAAPFTAPAKPLQSILGESSGAYLAHLSPLASVGAVVLCVPRLFVSPRAHQEPESAGGCMFVLENPPPADDLRDLYVIAHKYCLLAAGIEHIVEQKQVLDRDRFLQYASHTIIGPIADAIRYLQSAERELKSHTEVRRAISSLSQLRRDAQALLSVSKAEKSGALPEATAEGCQFDTAGRVAEYLQEIREYRALTELPPLHMECDCAEAPKISVAVPDLLGVLLFALIRNAVDHVNAAREQNLDAGDCPILIRAARREGTYSITVENGGPPVRAADIDALNAEEPDDTTWRVSRKGESHYRLGNRKIKWIARRLGGRLEYGLRDGRFMAVLCIKEKPCD